MTDQEKIVAIERDRRKREDELLLALLLLWSGEVEMPDGSILRRRINARTDTIVAVRHGLDYRGILSNFGTQASNAIALAMADAYRDGVRRAAVLSDETVPQSGEALKNWKDETAGTIESLSLIFRPAAREASNAMATSLGDSLEEYIPGVGDRISVTELKRSVREAFDTAGYTTFKPFALNRGTERAIVTAHNNGMFNAAKELEVVTGLQHFTILDGRETDICHERAGLTLPIDDPYWLTGIPQLHWGCRSGVFPVYGPQAWSTTYPTIPPQPGFGYASAVFIQRLRGGLAA